MSYLWLKFEKEIRECSETFMVGDIVELIQDDRFHYKVLDIIEDDLILEDIISGNRYRYKKELFKLKERKK